MKNSFAVAAALAAGIVVVHRTGTWSQIVNDHLKKAP